MLVIAPPPLPPSDIGHKLCLSCSSALTHFFTQFSFFYYNNCRSITEDQLHFFFTIFLPKFPSNPVMSCSCAVMYSRLQRPSDADFWYGEWDRGIEKARRLKLVCNPFFISQSVRLVKLTHASEDGTHAVSRESDRETELEREREREKTSCFWNEP